MITVPLACHRPGPARSRCVRRSPPWSSGPRPAPRAARCLDGANATHRLARTFAAVQDNRLTDC